MNFENSTVFRLKFEKKSNNKIYGLFGEGNVGDRKKTLQY